MIKLWKILIFIMPFTVLLYSCNQGNFGSAIVDGQIPDVRTPGPEIPGPEAPACKNSAVLTWDKTTTKIDGTPLTNLAGYKISYRTDSGSPILIEVNDPNATSYKFNNLTPGNTYYMSIKAVNASGIESAPSIEVSLKLDTCPP